MAGIELVGKIGSMALIERGDIDYNKFARIGRQLRPGTVWVTSGATEIGRLDYKRRTGHELEGDADEVKTDYAAQGQIVLMQTYRMFIDEKYSVRQLLVEHSHFNDAKKRRHIEEMLVRSAAQGAIPIVNYNDAVSVEENRKMEIEELKRSRSSRVFELVDNDETAAQIALLVRAKTLLILSTLEGIYYDVSDKSSLIRRLSGDSIEETLHLIDEAKSRCKGTSRAGSGGAAAKLEYVKPCVENGTKVIIASAKYDFSEIFSGVAPSTIIETKN